MNKIMLVLFGGSILGLGYLNFAPIEENEEDLVVTISKAEQDKDVLEGVEVKKATIEESNLAEPIEEVRSIANSERFDELNSRKDMNALMTGTYNVDINKAELAAQLSFSFLSNGRFTHERSMSQPEMKKAQTEGVYEKKGKDLLLTFSEDRDIELIPFNTASFKVIDDNHIKTGDLILSKSN